MAALTGDIHYERYGTGDTQSPLVQPLGGSVTVYRGSIALTDSTGNVKNASAPLSTDTCWGIIGGYGPGVADTAPGVINTSSVASAVTAMIYQGTFFLASGTGSDQLSQSTVGKTVYVINEYTVGQTSGGGNRPSAGVHIAVSGETRVQAPGSFAIKLGNTQAG
jgi:hypothetical protein